MPPQARFKVLVKQGKGEAIVRPPIDTAEAGGGPQSVIITNLTNSPILVSLPGGVFDEANNGGPVDPPAVYTIPSAAPNNVKNIPVHAAATKGLYSFRVFCQETFGFAQANSDPEFIIE